MGPKAWRENAQVPAPVGFPVPLTQLPPNPWTPAPLTVEGEVSKGGCEPIHAEHGTDGHIGHSLHSVLRGPEV